MQKLLFAELSSKIQRAHLLGLISYDTPEIEFNLNERFIAESIEYWPTWERLPSQHVLVQIPEDLRAQFRFDSVAMNVGQWWLRWKDALERCEPLDKYFLKKMNLIMDSVFI